MTIKVRVILGLLLTIVIMAGSTIPYVTSKMRDNAEQAYLDASREQLQIMGSYVEGFIGEAERNLAVLASNEMLINAEGLFPNYVNKKSETNYKRSDLDPEAARAIQPIVRLSEVNPAYAEVYAGYPNGDYGTSMKEGAIPGGFNSSKRPWYLGRMSSNKDVGPADGYLVRHRRVGSGRDAQHARPHWRNQGHTGSGRFTQGPFRQVCRAEFRQYRLLHAH